MAITARFVADFSSFSQAVEKADVELRSFETGANKVGSTLTRMANSLSGTRIIQDATLMAEAVERIGGISVLSERQLKKMGDTANEAMELLQKRGMEIPKGIQDIATAADNVTKSTMSWKDALVGVAGVFGVVFSLNAVKNFALGVVDAASAVGDLSVKLGVSTDAVQRWKYAADLSGSSIETVDRAVQNMNRTLSAGGTGTVAILKDAGLSFAELKEMRPEDAFNAITEAAAKLENPMLRAEVATKLFGRAGQELIPAMEAGFTKLSADAATFSEDTIKRLKAAEDAWTRLSHVVTIVSGEMIAEGLRVKDSWKDLFIGLGVPSFLRDSFREAIDLTDGFTGSLAKLKPVSVDVGAGLKSVALESYEVEHAINLSNEALNASIAQNKRVAEAMEEMQSAGAGWRGTLAGINAELVPALRFYLEAGVSQQALATFYGLTATQVKSVASALKEEADAQKLSARAIEATTKLWEEYNVLRVERSGTATDIQIAEIERWANGLAAHLRKAGADTAEFYTALTAVVREKIGAVMVDWEAVSANSSEVYQRTLEQTAQKAEATFQYMMSQSSGFSVATIQHFGEIAQAARDAANNWASSFESAGDTSVKAIEKTVEATNKLSAAMGVMLGVQVAIGDTTNEERMMGWNAPRALPILGNSAAAEGMVRNGSNATAVTVNNTGILLSNDPAAREQLSQMINASVAASLRSGGARV